MVDGQRLGKAAVARTRVLIANKRAGVIVSRRDPQGRPSVFDDLPRLRSGRWISVGRLDLQTTGLLLFTNDGELANKLAHPSTGIDREYAVRVFGRLEDAALERLKAGVVVNDRVEAFSDIRYYDGSGANHWYHVVLMEGRNREVRELFATEGVTVSRLKRVRYGPVILPPWLPRGTWGGKSAPGTSRNCRRFSDCRPGVSTKRGSVPNRAQTPFRADPVSEAGSYGIQDPASNRRPLMPLASGPMR